MTTNPQKIKKPIKSVAEDCIKINGEIKQQIQDKVKAINAILLVPKCSDKYPPTTQATPPSAMMKKESKGIFKSVCECIVE